MRCRCGFNLPDDKFSPRMIESFFSGEECFMCAWHRDRPRYAKPQVRVVKPVAKHLLLEVFLLAFSVLRKALR